MAGFAGELPVKLKAERIFYAVMAALMVVSIFAGFAPTFFLKPVLGTPQMLPITPLVALHGTIFSTWALLFVLQTWLVAGGRTDLHRRIGLVAFGLLPGMAVTGTLAAVYGAIRASGPPIVPPWSWMAVPLVSIPVYTALIGVALAKRRRPQAHKRLMFMAMVIMLGPAFGRMPPFHGPLGMVIIPALFAFAQVGWDYRALRYVHPATLWGGGVVIFAQVLPFLIWKTDGWLAFAGWAVGLASSGS
ncbi:hypothetical protein BH10PSE12_BH10PSE12_20830 [soil metagenome]